MCGSHLKQGHRAGFIHVSAESTFVSNQPLQVWDEIRILSQHIAIFWCCSFSLQSIE